LSAAVLSVGELVAHGPLELRAIAGASGLGRTVTVPRIQKPGLALTGWPEQLHPSRVLVIGGTEIDYLADNIVARTAGINTILASGPACVVVCRGLEAPPALRQATEEQGVPLLVSALVTADFIAAVTAWMQDRLAPSRDQHGVLLDVLGIGVLLLGKSGIGKSETALDLVVRGHRLVADDVIQLRRQGAAVTGAPAGILGHHMEIRGLGIINIKDLFGVSAVRPAKKIELVVELHEWSATEEYDRLGFEEQYEDVLGVAVPKVRIPVRPGRNLATLVEVAARNQLLKIQGTNSAQAFRDQLHRAMEAQTLATAAALDAVE
jgi:HPr kinase/phosphorylase